MDNNNFTNHIVILRNKFSPKTSYISGGKAATELYIINYHSKTDDYFLEQKDDIEYLLKSVIKSGEFNNYVEYKNASNIIKGNICIFIIYDDNYKNIQKLEQDIKDGLKKTTLCFVLLSKNIHDSSIITYLSDYFNKNKSLLPSFVIKSEKDFIPLTNDSWILFSLYSNSIQENKENVISFNGQPSVQSKEQFKYIWDIDNNEVGVKTIKRNKDNNISDIKTRLLQRLITKDIKNKETRRFMSTSDWDSLINSFIKRKKDDLYIYNYIHKLIYGKNLNEQDNRLFKLSNNMDADTTDADGRANFMVKMIIECIPKFEKINTPSQKIKTLLDYGCAEGSITGVLGKALNLSPENVYGADIRNIAAEGFTFIQLKSEEEYKKNGFHMFPSLENSSIDMITASMVLHHVTNIREILLELRRIISPTGCFIIREHQCKTPEMAAFLDITHGLYSLSWSNPVEWPNFIEEYKAYYRSRDEWTEIFKSCGFKLYDPNLCGKNAYNLQYSVDKVQIKNGKIINGVNAYYATYIPDDTFIIPLYNINKNNTYNDIDNDNTYNNDANNTDEIDNTDKGDINDIINVWESQKYPGKYYYYDDVNKISVWIKLKDIMNDKNKKYKINYNE